MCYTPIMPKRGPRTPAGRARSAMNALTHGILARTPVVRGAEDQAEWDRYIDGFTHSLQPADPFEAFLVERIAVTAWRLRRLEAHETGLLSIAQDRAEELAATRILHPSGDGAVSLHGASAATLIRSRIDRLRRLSDLLAAIQERRPGWRDVTPDDLQLLYEGLALALQPFPAQPADLPRHLLRQLSAVRPEEAGERANVAANVRALVLELEAMAGDEPAPGPNDASSPTSPALNDFLARFPAILVLVRLAHELSRLEAELLDLDATIDRTRREALILDDRALANVARYEAHLRRQLTQYLRELEARQTRRTADPTVLALPSPRLTS
jgi:hypothetical protein